MKFINLLTAATLALVAFGSHAGTDDGNVEQNVRSNQVPANEARIRRFDNERQMRASAAPANRSKAHSTDFDAEERAESDAGVSSQAN